MEGRDQGNIPQGIINIENYRQLYYRMFPYIFRGIDGILNEENIINESFNEQTPKSKPMAADTIQSLEEYEVMPEDIEKKLSCAICQDGFKLGEKVIRLPCSEEGHFFHNKVDDQCLGIMPWLKENNTCPICRYEFPYEPEPKPEVEHGTETESINEEGNVNRVTNDTIDRAIEDILNSIRTGTSDNISENLNIPPPIRIVFRGYDDDNDEELQAAILESMEVDND